MYACSMTIPWSDVWEEESVYHDCFTELDVECLEDADDDVFRMGKDESSLRISEKETKFSAPELVLYMKTNVDGDTWNRIVILLNSVRLKIPRMSEDDLLFEKEMLLRVLEDHPPVKLACELYFGGNSQ